MIVIADQARRRIVLAELGLTAWRLRAPVSAGAGAVVHEPSRHDEALLRVYAPDRDGAPTSGVAARIWAQVVAWQGRSADDFDWLPAGAATPDAVRLPPVAQWASPEGKRQLWLALKSRVRR